MSSMSTADAYNAGFVTGEYIERERIIALIESEASNHGNPNAVNMLLSLIALIKGDE